MKKIPKYMDNIVDFVAEKEEKYLKTPKAKAKENMIKEALEESMTAKNPVAKDNPTKPAVSELTKAYYQTFEKSVLGQSLSPEEKKELWRDIELFCEKIVSPMMEKVMGFRMKREGDRRSSLEFPQKKKDEKGNLVLSKEEKDEIASEIEEARYYKLFLTCFYMGLLERFFHANKLSVNSFIKTIENNKTWRDLNLFSNRLAHAETVRESSRALMKNMTIRNMASWARSNKESVDKIYAKAKKEQEKRNKEFKNKGIAAKKQKQEEIAKLTPVEPGEE